MFSFLSFQSPVCGNPQETSQGRKVVISHNMDRALKDGEDGRGSWDYYVKQSLFSKGFVISSLSILPTGVSSYLPIGCLCVLDKWKWFKHFIEQKSLSSRS